MMEEFLHQASVAAVVVLPFFYYWFLWTYPKIWCRYCKQIDINPCKLMAHVSLFFKLLQFAALASVADFSAWPQWYGWLLIIVGQALNFRVYQLLHQDGVYYGIRFGREIGWVNEFPFGYMNHPQYIGSMISLLGCICWLPYYYIALWCSGYIFMMFVESNELPSTRFNST